MVRQLLRRMRKRVVLLDSKFRPRTWQRATLVSPRGRQSTVLLKPRKLIGSGDIENRVFSVDIVKGNRVLRLVEKVYSHSDPKAVWFDMKILNDLRKAGCRVPRTIRVRDEKGFMPTLVLSDLRFSSGEKNRILPIRTKEKIKNLEEIKQDILRQVELAAKAGYELDSASFFISVDKRGNGIAFVADVDWVNGPDKVDLGLVIAKWKKILQ